MGMLIIYFEYAWFIMLKELWVCHTYIKQTRNKGFKQRIL